jgi:hypothetical protein
VKRHVTAGFLAIAVLALAIVYFTVVRGSSDSGQFVSSLSGHVGPSIKTGGPKHITVPNVIGRPGPNAARALGRAGLLARQVPPGLGRASGAGPPPVVREQPPPGATARRGSRVTLYVRAP